MEPFTPLKQDLPHPIDNIIRNGSLFSVYQPIVDLRKAEVFGYEALTRGRMDDDLLPPEVLFDAAKNSGRLYALEQIARESAIKGFEPQEGGRKIFINLNASIVHDPRFKSGKTLALLRENGLEPQQVVFEITERESIKDFGTVKKVLDHYRGQGYAIAIDDAGAGYSSLQAIAELHPDYIKIDRSLVHHIHRDKNKYYIFETFTAFARKMNIGLIAEGIEHKEELQALISMGVRYGQGYLLGMPDILPAPLIQETVQWLKNRRKRWFLDLLGFSN